MLLASLDSRLAMGTTALEQLAGDGRWRALPTRPECNQSPPVVWQPARNSTQFFKDSHSCAGPWNPEPPAAVRFSPDHQTTLPWKDSYWRQSVQPNHMRNQRRLRLQPNGTRVSRRLLIAQAVRSGQYWLSAIGLVSKFQSRYLGWFACSQRYRRTSYQPLSLLCVVQPY